MADSTHSAAWVISALGRAGYGARPEDLTLCDRRGFAAWHDWVETQLSPREDQDGAVHERLAALQLRIKYPAKAAPDVNWSARDEMLPLQYLGKPIGQAWPLIVQRKTMDGAERRRPRDEAAAATILRAVHSRWQLREVMASFWHDHFNVDAYGSEEVAVALPVYDQEVIRPHAFGNFRQFLEAVATSTAMLYYLSNRTSRAGSANENFGRELFELHTLGRDAYLNDKYDRWRAVPGALAGNPAGYIDEDVYESARAFTGWTVEDGSAIDGQRKLPATGRFTYVEAWHDGYQKRVLAHEFKEFGAPMSDGRTVLDLVAYHPATARYVCTKLARRFIGDNPPKRVVAAAIDIWTKTRRAPDQIARTVRVILLSPEFAAAQGAKVRRPLAVAAAFARATNLDLTPTEPLWNAIAGGGQRLFGWAPPTGLPDRNAYFLGANSMRQRWAMVLGLSDNRWGTGVLQAPEPLMINAVTPRRAATHYLSAMQGVADPATVEVIVANAGAPPDAQLGEAADPKVMKQLARLAALCAMTPQFQSV